MIDTPSEEPPFELPPDMVADYADIVSQYADSLTSRGLPILFSPKHFCQLVGVDPNYAFAVANEPKENYRTLRVRKRSGGVRIINEPLPTLKLIQRWILDNILSRKAFHKAATAYIRRRSIKDNARIHRAQPTLLKLDITSFFPSVRIGSVFETFYELGYTKPIATLLAHLCTLNGVLPQGAPTSGALANAHMIGFDQRALDFCLSSGLRYTRYSDDITVSGDKIIADVVAKWFEAELANIGLHLNAKKTVHAKSGSRLLVTGLVVNEKVNVLRSTMMQIRQEFYYIQKFGPYSHAKRIGHPNALYPVEALAGRIAFAIGIRPHDKNLRRMLAMISDTRGKLRKEARRSGMPTFQTAGGKGSDLERAGGLGVVFPLLPAPRSRWDEET